MIMCGGPHILVAKASYGVNSIQHVGRSELLLSRSYNIALVWFGKYDHPACYVLRSDVSCSWLLP